MTVDAAQGKRFEFATATRIIFGAGALGEVGPQARAMGRQALVVTGRATERAASLLDLLAAQEIARILTGNDSASADDGVAWVQDLCQALQVPSLASYGMRREDLPSVVEKSSAASSMRGNPIELTPDELREILERAL